MIIKTFLKPSKLMVVSMFTNSAGEKTQSASAAGKKKKKNSFSCLQPLISVSEWNVVCQQFKWKWNDHQPDGLSARTESLSEVCRWYSTGRIQMFSRSQRSWGVTLQRSLICIDWTIGCMFQLATSFPGILGLSLGLCVMGHPRLIN